MTFWDEVRRPGIQELINMETRTMDLEDSLRNAKGRQRQRHRRRLWQRWRLTERIYHETRNCPRYL